jgi:hypothetical protein
MRDFLNAALDGAASPSPEMLPSPTCNLQFSTNQQPERTNKQTRKTTNKITKTTMTAALAFGLSLAMTDRLRADTFGSGANTFTIDFVTIGNPGNADDAGAGGGSYWTPYGGVSYTYRMGVYEISQEMITKATNLGLANVTAGAWGASQPAVGMFLKNCGATRGTAQSLGEVVRKIEMPPARPLPARAVRATRRCSNCPSATSPSVSACIPNDAAVGPRP